MNRAVTLHYVYEFYDASGACLYVGCTSMLGARLGNHATVQPWWTDVAHVSAVAYPDQEAGLAAERERIRSLTPLYNRVHNPARPPENSWATRLENARARHERGELCGTHARCRHCIDLRAARELVAA